MNTSRASASIAQEIRPRPTDNDAAVAKFAMGGKRTAKKDLAMEAISYGYCLLGNNKARDYWGNTIPSRSDVKEGSKGSFDYVASLRGADWAEQMEAV